MRNKFLYRVLSSCESSTYEFSTLNDEEDGVYLAQDAAEDYHSKHDGWESSWPLEFLILTLEETEVGRFEVDRDVAPVFHAAFIKETK